MRACWGGGGKGGLLVQKLVKTKKTSDFNISLVNFSALADVALAEVSS